MKYCDLAELLDKHANGVCTPAEYHPRLLWSIVWPVLKTKLIDGELPQSLVNQLSCATCTEPATVKAEVKRRIALERLKAVMKEAELEQLAKRQLCMSCCFDTIPNPVSLLSNCF